MKTWTVYYHPCEEIDYADIRQFVYDEDPRVSIDDHLDIQPSQAVDAGDLVIVDPDVFPIHLA